MKRPTRHEDGHYHLENKKYKILIGSRQQVWNETAYKTEGGLKKKDLFYNSKTHRIVSKKKHITAKKEMRLEKHGYFAKKGNFGFVKKQPHKTRKHRK